MKVTYGQSMVEGAPFGNKNAVGSHHGKGKIIGITVNPVSDTHSSVTFVKSGKLQSKTYPKVEMVWLVLQEVLLTQSGIRDGDALGHHTEQGPSNLMYR